MTPDQLHTLAEARDLVAAYKANGVGAMLRVGRIEAAMRIIGLLLAIIDDKQKEETDAQGS